MPPGPGLWGFEVLLFQDGSQEPLRSLRNIDFWEPLVPGQAHDLTVQIGPLGDVGELTFDLTPHMPGWVVEMIPNTLLINDPTQVYFATLRTTPPLGITLGSFSPIVDVEGFLDRVSIGGLRKLDSAAVPLHGRLEPSYAENEISLSPYPVTAGMPTEICVVLRNPTAYAQDVLVNFSYANFGIGLPFTLIHDAISVNLPPYSLVKPALTGCHPSPGMCVCRCCWKRRTICR